MKIRVLTLFCLSVVILSPNMFGQETGTIDEPVVTNVVTCKFLDKYLGANGGIFYDKDLTQCDLQSDFRGGLYMNVWVSTSGRNDWMSNFDDEIDGTLGWVRAIGAFTYDVGLSYYAIAKGPSGNFADVMSPTLEVSRALELATAFARVEHYLPVEGRYPGSGFIFRVGARRGTTLHGVDVASKTQVSYDTGAFDSDNGFFFDIQITALKQIGPMGIGPLVKFSTPLSSVSDGRGDDWAFGLVVRR